MGSQHPSPNVKTLCNETQIWLEIITSRDAKTACFKGSRTSCREIIFGILGANLARKDHITWWMFRADKRCPALGPPEPLEPSRAVSRTLLRTFLEGVLSHDPLGVHPISGKSKGHYRRSKDFSCQANPQNPWERRKNAQKKQRVPCEGKRQGLPKNNDLYRANGRVGFGSQTAADPFLATPGKRLKSRLRKADCDSISQNVHPSKYFGGVPTTPDPNTSEKVSRYKWEAYRDTNWWCIYYFLPRGGHTFAKVSR